MISKSNSVLFVGCALQNTHSESMIPDQGEHLERPYSKTQHYPFPIIVCLLLHPCSLPWLHLIEIPLLRAPYLNLVNDSSQLCFAGLCNLTERLGDGGKMRRLIINPPGFSRRSFFLDSFLSQIVILTETLQCRSVFLSFLAPVSKLQEL